MQLLDCELLSKVYINLLDQKEPTFESKMKKDLIKCKIHLSIKYL